MSKSKKVVIGYWYGLGIHMGVCRGPINRLLKIMVGDKVAWTGSVTGNTEFAIKNRSLFGGEKKEGGLDGTVATLFGASDQPVHQRLAAMLGGLVPAFRGVFSVFWDGWLAAMSPYLKPWSFQVERTTAGWSGNQPWYPARCAIAFADSTNAQLNAANPAHVLWQIYTDPRLSRGLAPSRMDDAAFKAAADTLYDEGFGVCIAWDKRTSIKNFAQTMIDHVGGAIYTDRHTGLLSFRLIRGGYDPATLPLFTPDTGLLGIDEDEIAGLAGAVNEVIVNYVEPSDGEQRSVRVKNIAGITAGGAVISVTREYPGLPTRALALRCALRDLRSLAGGLRKFKLRLDRRAYRLMPGDVFRIAEPLRGIDNIVLRAGRCEYGEGGDATITVIASQDVFGLPSTVYVTPEPPAYNPMDTTPYPITTARLHELSYLDFAANQSAFNPDTLDDTAGQLTALASKPSGLSLGFRPVSGPGWYPASDEVGDFTPSAVLTADLAPMTASFVVAGLTDLYGFDVPGVALIDDEIVRVDAINAASGAITIARGVADTVPAPHAAGARIWFYGSDGAWLDTVYDQGQTVQIKLRTVTPDAELDLPAAPTLSTTITARVGRPYPPGNFRLNNQRYPATITGPFTVSWAHRDRVTQSDLMIPTTDGNIGPEDGVTYTLELFDQTGTRVRTATGITGTSYTWTTESEDSGLPTGTLNTSLRVVLYAVRDGVRSLQSHNWTSSR